MVYYVFKDGVFITWSYEPVPMEICPEGCIVVESEHPRPRGQVVDLSGNEVVFSDYVPHAGE